MLLIPRTEPRPGDILDLLTQSELRDYCTIALNIFLLEIVEQAAALTDHLKKATAGMVILMVDFEMLSELRDTLREDSDLNLGRTCIGFVEAVVRYNLSLFLFENHCFHLSFIIFAPGEVSGW